MTELQGLQAAMFSVLLGPFLIQTRAYTYTHQYVRKHVTPTPTARITFNIFLDYFLFLLWTFYWNSMFPGWSLIKAAKITNNLTELWLLHGLLWRAIFGLMLISLYLQHLGPQYKKKKKNQKKEKNQKKSDNIRSRDTERSKDNGAIQATLGFSIYHDKINWNIKSNQQHQHFSGGKFVWTKKHFFMFFFFFFSNRRI